MELIWGESRSGEGAWPTGSTLSRMTRTTCASIRRLHLRVCEHLNYIASTTMGRAPAPHATVGCGEVAVAEHRHAEMDRIEDVEKECTRGWSLMLWAAVVRCGRCGLLRYGTFGCGTLHLCLSSELCRDCVCDMDCESYGWDGVAVGARKLTKETICAFIH